MRQEIWPHEIRFLESISFKPENRTLSLIGMRKFIQNVLEETDNINLQSESELISKCLHSQNITKHAIRTSKLQLKHPIVTKGLIGTLLGIVPE